MTAQKNYNKIIIAKNNVESKYVLALKLCMEVFMKNVRKIALFLVAALVLTIIPSNIVSALKIGDEIGDVLNTDIKTYIDGERIPSYNINGKSAVLIKDLKNYGFDSSYDNVLKKSTVKFSPNKKFTPMTDFDEQTGKIGTVAFKYVYTDIVAIINGKEVESFNIKGNLAIFFSDLSIFGKIAWNNEKRESRLTLSTPVSSISLNRTSASISVDDIIHLTPTIAPADATDKSVTWTSSNESVAMVGNGRVVGLSAGTTTITATASNGKTATCTVTVTSAVLVNSLSFDVTAATIKVNESIVLNPYFYPANSTDKTLTWTTSNSSVARVDTYGRVTGVATGTATITATTANGKTTKCTITVATAATKITLNTSSTTVAIGDYVDLSATISPSNATDKTVTWYSSNSSVARVDNYGRVTGVASGSATITAESSNGLTANCSITVSNNYITSISINSSQKSITLQPGNSTTIYVTTYPNNVSSSYLTWTSSNPNVATVDSYGKVTAVNYYDSYYGNTARITVTAYSSSGYTVSDYCDVTVGSSTVSVSASSNSISAGGAVTFTVDNYWAYNSSYYFSWSFSGATVSSGSGSSITVYAASGVSSITATVTVYSYSNGYPVAYSSPRTVTVSGSTVYVTGVTINGNPYVGVGYTTQLTANVTPNNATNKSVTWKSSDTSIATVSSSGVVTGVKQGSATITATTTDGTNISNFYTITVNAAP